MKNYKSQENKRMKEKFVKSRESNTKTDPLPSKQEKRLSRDIALDEN